MSDTQETPTPSEAPKSKKQMSFTVLESGDIRADFGAGLDPIQFTPATLPESLFPQALAEGLISRLRSAASKLADEARNPTNLRSAVAAALESLKLGEWKMPRASSAAGPEISMEAEAAHIFRSKRAAERGEAYTATLEEDAAAFATLSDEQKAKLKATDRYKLALAEVKADRAAKKAAKMAEKVAQDESEVDF